MHHRARWAPRAVPRQYTLQDAQNGRPARPQRAKGRIVLLRYGEPLSDARTPLADFFRILLERIRRQTVETFLNAACAQGRVRPVSQLYEGNLLPTLQALAVDPRPCLAERQNILASRTRPIHLNALSYEAHTTPPVLRVSWSSSDYSAKGTGTSGQGKFCVNR